MAPNNSLVHLLNYLQKCAPYKRDGRKACDSARSKGHLKIGHLRNLKDMLLVQSKHKAN